MWKIGKLKSYENFFRRRLADTNSFLRFQFFGIDGNVNPLANFDMSQMS